MRQRLSPLLLLLATVGLSVPKAQAQSWTTATHVGMSVEDGSSTGYHKVAGSMFFLDLARAVGSDLELGLRTIGQGGRDAGRQFARLGAGPLLTWNISKSWRLQAAISAFDESGKDAQGLEEYRSRGHSEFVGWGRRFAIGRKVELGYGGFLARYQGSLRQSDTSTTAAATSLTATENRGFGHGIAASLKIQLD